MTEISPRARRLLADFENFERVTGAELTVYSEGLFYASVCTSLDDTAADAAMASRPSGTDGWTRADEPFADGSDNPSPCPDVPGRRHILYGA